MNDLAIANNSAHAQRAKVMDWLHAHGALTTIQAREQLDILHVPSRVLELRAQGKNIITQWVREMTAAGVVHRVGRYVLMSRRNQK